MKETATILLDGRTQVLSFAAARTLVRELDTQAWDHNRAEAERLARCGWIILQFAGGRTYDVYAEIVTKMGVHTNRGKRMRKYAEHFIDPETGTFCEMRWGRAVRKAKQRAANGEDSFRTNARGEPSLAGIERADGMRRTRAAHPNKVPNEMAQVRDFVREHPNRTADGATHGRDFNSAVFGGRGRGSVLEACLVHAPAGRRASSSDAGCVGAEQPDLPWHLAESARRLADAAAGLEARLAAGHADRGFARDVQERIDAILADLEAAHAVGGAA